MKLKLEKQSHPRVEKIKVDGETANKIDSYIAYVQQGQQQKIKSAELICMMIKEFMKSDREFMKWQRTNHIQQNT